MPTMTSVSWKLNMALPGIKPLLWIPGVHVPRLAEHVSYRVGALGWPGDRSRFRGQWSGHRLLSAPWVSPTLVGSGWLQAAGIRLGIGRSLAWNTEPRCAPAGGPERFALFNTALFLAAIAPGGPAFWLWNGSCEWLWRACASATWNRQSALTCSTALPGNCCVRNLDRRDWPGAHRSG